jgi:hypothetical protein
MRRMWKEAALPQYVPGGTGENHEKPVRIAGLRVEI